MTDSEKRIFAKNILDSISADFLDEAISFLESLRNRKSSENSNQIGEDLGEIAIYTDGGCHGNPGAGGWAVVIIADGEARQISGGEKMTTNNRMELLAAINALLVIAETPRFVGRKTRIFTDSQYVKNGITSWILNWKKNGWLTKAKKEVLNRELWEKLDELNLKVNPEWAWVKGHAGLEFNEICDKLCQMEIAKFE